MTTVPTEDDAGAGFARRAIGRKLAELRKSFRRSDGKPFTHDDAAEVLEIARPTMWKIEQGLPGVRLKDYYINTLCDLYGASDEERQQLLNWAVTSRVKGWFHPYLDVLPAGFDIYLSLESKADDITAYEGERVHGLWQTGEYAWEILRIPGPDGSPRNEDEIARRVQVRLRRQSILTRTSPAPVNMRWLVGEGAFRRRVGNAAVTTRQLDHINQLGELPHITVQVIPFEAGLHQGIDSGPFARLRFPDNTEPPTVYADGFMGNLLISKAEQVARFDAAITGMRSCALDEQKSRDLIHRVAKEHLRA